MINRDLRLELTFWGSILDCHVFINDNEVDGWDYDRKKKVRYRVYDSLQLEDSFDLEIIAKGKNGASVKLEVIIEGLETEIIEGVVEDGVTKVNKTITVQ